MKVLSAAQTREADAFTIQHEPVTSLDLMERAAGACTHWLLARFGKEKHYRIFCGPGNNGGDGLVIARQMREAGSAAAVFFLPAENYSEDHLANRSKLGAEDVSEITKDLLATFHFTADDVVVDALYGSGLNRAPEGLAADTIETINSSGCPVIAIDIPSGLKADEPNEERNKIIVRATVTLTFQQPKRSFFFAENAAYVGHFEILPIGLHPVFLNGVKCFDHYVDISFAKSFYHSREKFSHKGTYGHVLLFAGSRGKAGAAVLASRAALRAGAGLVSVRVPSAINDIIQTAVPEVMTIPDDEENFLGSSLPSLLPDALAAGPGIGTEKITQQLIKLLIQQQSPMVLDADAINILSENKTWLGFLPGNTILTPHPGEFDRLAGKHSSGYSRYETQRDLSVKHGVIIILKGAHTSISCPDGNVFFNSTGNPGMATAGSGDVLTGILVSLLAQDYEPRDAAILGVFLHGMAGDIAASLKTEEGMMAGDIIEALPEAWKRISS